MVEPAAGRASSTPTNIGIALVVDGEATDGAGRAHEVFLILANALIRFQ